MQSPTISSAVLRVTDLGRMAYGPALELQRRVNQAVSDGVEPATLLLVEHDPVITVSHRKEAAGHVIAPADRLAALGIAVAETDRGGDVTYHGPGQLVAYPILRMSDYGLNLSRYMRFLEDVVIETLAAWGVEGVREAGATGVWVGRPESHVPCPGSRRDFEDARLGTRDDGTAKVCAMGVRVRKNVTMHGLALNVTADLSHFGTIVPCGLHGRAVTSLRELLGERCPLMDEVKGRLVTVFRERLAAMSRAAIEEPAARA